MSAVRRNGFSKQLRLAFQLIFYLPLAQKNLLLLLYRNYNNRQANLSSWFRHVAGICAINLNNLIPITKCESSPRGAIIELRLIKILSPNKILVE